MSEIRQGAVLRLERKKEHSLHISKNILDQKEMMYPAYEQALIALRGILESSEEWWRRWTERKYTRRNTAQVRHGEDLYEYSSNIIAFCGGRGEGKTSTMRSFANALENWRSYKETESKAIRNIMRDEDIDYVYAIPPIDPTVLEDKDSVMAMILSHLFYEAEEQWKSPPRELNEAERYYRADDERQHPWKDPSVQYAYSETGKNELMRRFQNCFEEVRTLQKKSWAGSDTLDALYQLGDSFDLKEDFHELLLMYFTLLGKDIRKSLLLIQLDDTDLQFTKAYSVMEETRKYLSLPNVIVVMATNVDQLRFLVAQHYYEQLKLALEKNELGDADVRVMAAKYLDKLIPSTHAIYLPNIRLNYETGQMLELEIAGIDQEKESRERKSENSERKTENKGELQQALFKLIYEKTGIVFIRHRFYVHSILPRTLRGMSHLYRLLDNMETPAPAPVLGSPNADEYTLLTREDWLEYCEARVRRSEVLLKNLRRFEDYFLNDWCSSRLLKEHWDSLREIRREAIPSQSIPYTINLLDNLRRKNQRGNQQGESLTSMSRSVSDLNYNTLNQIIANPEDVGYIGYSYADYAFGFALHTFFSIQFHKLTLQRQIYELEVQPKVWMEVGDHYGDRTVFSFNYSEIQKLLAPQVFDSDRIQKSVKDTPEEKPVRYPFYYSVGPVDSVETYNEQNQAGYYRLFFRQENRGLYCDFLSIFYNSLFNQWKIPSRGLTVFDQRSMINMQDAALYVCCNWDAQDQIIKALQDIDSFGTRRYDRELSDADPDYPLEFANSLYTYLFQYLFAKQAPSLPDCSGETKHESNEEGDSRDDYLDKFVYCVRENVEYYKAYSQSTAQNQSTEKHTSSTDETGPS